MLADTTQRRKPEKEIRLDQKSKDSGTGEISLTGQNTIYSRLVCFARLPAVSILRNAGCSAFVVSQMKAIVLTCDRFRAITEHMIRQYETLWPDHPFVFRVPYQNLRGSDT